MHHHSYRTILHSVLHFFLCSSSALFCLSLAACNDHPQTVTETTSPAKPLQEAPLPAPLILVQQKKCIVCHTIDNKMVGPSWKSVAAHYRNDKNALDTITAKILNGGSGTFGSVVMPPQKMQLSSEEAKYLAQWVLNLK